MFGYGENHNMENTVVAFDIFKQLEGSWMGTIRLKNISMSKISQIHSDLERRGEKVPNYLMKAEGHDVVLTLDVCRTCKGTGKTNAS